MAHVEVDRKLTFLVELAEAINAGCVAVKDPHVARNFGRAIFLVVDNFLVYAPILKNRIVAGAERDAIDERLRKLRVDYDGYYALIRDKMAGHHQQIDMLTLLERWNEIDEITTTVFTDELRATYDALAAAGQVPVLPPTNLSAFGKASAAFREPDRAPRWGMGLLVGTQDNVANVIPCHPTQEKAQRVVTIMDGLNALAEYSVVTRINELSNFVMCALFLVDVCSLLTNLFDDRPADREGQSLLTLWKAGDYGGVPVLSSFKREESLENTLLDARNKTYAHLDSDDSLADIIRRHNALNLGLVSKYVSEIFAAVSEGFRRDMRTQVYLLHGMKLNVVQVVNPEPPKPFRAT